MSQLLHVSPSTLMVQALQLGKKLYDTGFRPKHAVSIWRGGTAVGLYVDTYFRMQGLAINHTTIATESYQGIGVQDEVVVKGLEHVIQSICREDGLLILDDVYETGHTIKAILDTLKRKARANYPEKIMVGTIHRKPDKAAFRGVDVKCLEDVDSSTWIDYPHELADLINDDPEDPLVKEKDPIIWNILKQTHFEPSEETISGPYKYVTPEDMLYDALKLGVNIFHDKSFQPDFIVALWPGGVNLGLPLHEAYKYLTRKSGEDRRKPDHISLNTMPSRLTYETNVVGLDYLADRIDREHNVLIIDSTFKSGRLVNEALFRMKEVLRRNLDINRVRVASLYWNPEDDVTWTVQPVYRRPHYYLKKVKGKIIYSHAVHRLGNPRSELLELNPEAARVLFA